jgi:thiamine biosynthesis lipoprotein
MSTYLPNSLISKINDGKENVVLDDHFLNVFKKSSQVFSITNGYFDPTVGSIVNAYGFGPSGGINKISPFQIDSIKKLIGWEKLNLVDERVISKQHPNIFIDFNSIAKGYMIDIIDKYLVRLGSENHLIDIGGEIKATGINITTKKKVENCHRLP